MEQIFLFILGLLLGSFLNVCIYRLPNNESVVYPASHCMKCNHQLMALDLIPVLSYICLGRKCRYCGATISPCYALIELLTGCLFVFSFYELGMVYVLVQALILTCFLIVITWIDYDHQLILDKVLLCMAVAGTLLHLAFDYIGSPLQIEVDWIDSFLGFLAGGGLLFAIAMLSGGGMGGGDIKFAAVLGLWFGWKFTLLILFLAFIVGGISGVILLLLRRKERKGYVPFGPFIAIAAYIVYFYGVALYEWYFQFF